MKQDQHILESWRNNADAWITTIENNEIESRRLVTNAAIIAAIAAYQPHSLLDLGCGEGWLCRAAAGAIPSLKKIIGLDAIPGLIAVAATYNVGEYQVVGYEDIIEERFHPSRRFDSIVFNFSLFGDEQVQQLLTKIHPWLNQNGKLIIQTLHPFAACGEQPYKDRWRDGNWNGFSTAFTNPAPWYFRTLESWVALLNNSSYCINAIKEPLHPVTNKPASVIFIGETMA